MNNELINQSKTKELVYMGLSIALIYVATLIKFEIPTPNGGGLVHLGTGMALIIILLFGKKVGAISGACAMALFDITSSYTIWAPTTFITRLIMGIIVGTIATKNGKVGESFSSNLLSIMVGGIWMIIGYYIGEAITFGNWVTPMASIGGNFLQILVGGIMALILVPIIKSKVKF